MKKLIKRIFLKFFAIRNWALKYKDKKSFKNIDESVINSDSKNLLLGSFFSIIKGIQFEPVHIVDVGANHGNWTREALLQFPNAIFTLLEPQISMKNSINDLLEKNKNISFNAVGAGRKAGSFKFTIVDRDDSCSFRYSEQEAEERGYGQIIITVVTLNEFIAEKNLPVPDMIKIDAEGLDIEVLEGASDFFGKTEVFLVEAGVVNKEFSNSFLEIINYMNLKGYRLFDITDLNRPFIPTVLWLVELAFVKKNGIIDSHNWI